MVWSRYGISVSRFSGTDMKVNLSVPILYGIPPPQEAEAWVLKKLQFSMLS